MRKTTVEALRRASVTSSHVDWVTTTTQTVDASHALWDVGEQRLSAGKLKGELPTRWHAHGYAGWQTAHVALGARADGAYLRLSGPESSEHWLKALTTAEHCTRIDLAVDVHLDTPVTSVVSELYRKIPHERRHGGRPPMRRLTMDTNGGQTLYLGSRTSERFARLYDKGIESKSAPAGRWWRWELELKQRMSERVAELLERSVLPSDLVARLVSGFFHQRLGIAIAELPRLVINNETQETTSADRQLRWLASGVRPTVAKLIEHYGRDRVLHALGVPLKSAVEPAPPHDAPTRSKRCPQ